jgi:hypothetical protein
MAQFNGRQTLSTDEIDANIKAEIISSFEPNEPLTCSTILQQTGNDSTGSQTPQT